MVIKGFQKVSLIDYPGKVAAVVFVAGCNFRCPYCYNRDLVLTRPEDRVFEVAEVLRDLQERRNFLDGVVLTGGEPTLQKDLLEFVGKVKSFPSCYTCSGDKILLEHYFVKIDTNGSQPSILQSMVVDRLLDYIALDVKAPLDHRYGDSVGAAGFDITTILQSMEKIVESGVDFELRTTVVPTLHSEKDLLDLARQLSEIAPKAKWYLQNFQPKNCLDPEFEKVEPYDNIFLGELVEKLRSHMPNIGLRN